MIPKYIIQKINKLDKMLENAYELKHDIEKWAEKNGADTSSMEWYDMAVNDCNAVNGICEDGIKEYFKTI